MSAVPPAGGPPRRYEYLRCASEIYARSFERVRSCTAALNLPVEVTPLAERLVHTTGSADVAAQLRWHADPVATAHAALLAAKPVLVDSEMVRAGITQRFLPRANAVLCTLNDAATRPRAAAMATTRSAAAVDAWAEHLDGAVVAIGNAPTALFRLLELLHEGAAMPAVVFAFPVGFVGAAESKQALIDARMPFAYATIPGTRGGSALAAAAINAAALATQSR